MPELPEVEVIRRGLQPHVKGCKVLHVHHSGKDLRTPFPQKLLLKWIKGHRIQNLSRRAKYLVFTMDNKARMLIHLGMTGKLGIFSPKTPAVKHDHLVLTLDNNLEIRLNDTRRFSSIQVIEPDKTAPALQGLGPEPFWQTFTPQYLQKLCVKSKRPVKNTLMDARIVAGIGNIYANEILFAAKINPSRPANSIQPKEWEIIIRCCIKVLSDAIAHGGTTISDFANAENSPGYFQIKLNVYGKTGEPCQRCKTKIEKITQAGRSSFYCPECQK